MSATISRKLDERKRRVLRRIRHRPGVQRVNPMIEASNIQYEVGERVQGIAAGGIGAFVLLVRAVGLVRDLDRKLHLLKRHLPYHESDHVLTIALNILAGGRRIEHLEERRTDEAFLDALGAERIPDPTTTGDFCRRFSANDIQTLMDTINQPRLRVWKQQPASFLTEAIIDVDGTIAPSDANCKEGVDVAYNGVWGYHPLIISLANTAEPVYLVNRPGNRPSHEEAHSYLDRAIALCREAGFRAIRLRGDTDFSQTKYLDQWHEQGIRFLFGMDAKANLIDEAENLPGQAYQVLERPLPYDVKTAPRQRRQRLKRQIVQDRQFRNIETALEEVAEFPYTPRACSRAYRVIVLRKTLHVHQGQLRLVDEGRYFFFITNDWATPADKLVLEANQRCNQENLIAQLKGDVGAMTMPLGTLMSNWAYMVMAALAWSLKAWSALLVPVLPDQSAVHETEKRTLLRMEFRTFCAAVLQMPCQIVRSGRRLIYRLLSWNPWQAPFLRLVDRLHGRLLC